MTDCSDMEKLIASSRLGLLDRREEASVASHARTCEACSEVARTIEEALGDVDDGEGPPEHVWERLSTEIAQHREGGEGLKPGGGLKVSLACTFCHASVLPRDKVFCSSCLAPHHAECFEEHGTCAAPGCAERRFVRPELPRSAVAEPAASRRVQGILIVLTVGTLGGAAALSYAFKESVSAPPPRVVPPPVAQPLAPPAPVVTTPGPTVVPATPEVRPEKRDQDLIPAPREERDPTPPPVEETPVPGSREVLVRRATLGVLPGGAVRPGEQLCDSAPSVVGVPSESRMETFRLPRSGGAVKVADEDMWGGWVQGAMVVSPDRRTVLAHTFRGFKLVRGDQRVEIQQQFLYRGVVWSPDSKWIAAWLPKGIAIADVDELFRTGEAKFRIVHAMPVNGPAFTLGMDWSGAEELIVVVRERFTEDSCDSRIVRVPFRGFSETLYSTTEPIEWFQAYHREGKLEAIVFATQRAVSAVRPRGDVLGEVRFETGRIHELVVSPAGTEIALVRTIDKRREAVLVHLGRPAVDAVEPLGALGVEQVRFSRTGTFVAWFTSGKLGVRYATVGTDKGFELAAAEFGGQIGGIAWHPEAVELAVAGRGQLSIVDASTQRARKRFSLPDNEKALLGEPVWSGSELLFSAFTARTQRRRGR